MPSFGANFPATVAGWPVLAGWTDDCIAVEAGDWRGLGHRRLAAAASTRLLADPEAWLELPGAKVIKRGRNDLARVPWPGESGRSLFLKISPVRGLVGTVQGGWGESKARRAWTKAVTLLLRGFATPRPLLVLESQRGGRRTGSAIWTEWTEGRQLREWLKPWRARPRSDEDTAACRAFLQRIAEYLRQLHEAGIVHRDFGGGNVLVDGEGHFTLVDVNRAWIADGPAPWRWRLLDLERVHVHPEDREVLLDAYCRNEAERREWKTRYLRRAARYRGRGNGA